MANHVEMWTPISGQSFEYGQYIYTLINSEELTVEAISKEQTNYEPIPESISINGVTYDVTSMDRCFEGCVNLISAPAIPSEVTSLISCFEGCINLTGNIEVYNDPGLSSTNWKDIFTDTVKPIFIINKANAEDNWKEIALLYNNVHYEAEDNSKPNIVSIKANRGNYDNNRWTTDDSGDDIRIELTFNLFTDCLPVGWEDTYVPYDPNENPNESSTIGVYIDDTSVNYTIDSSSINDDNKIMSPLILYITGHENSGIVSVDIEDNYNHFSALKTVDVYNVFVMLDFIPGGKGMAIGKAGQRNGLDIAIPTAIGDHLLLPTTYFRTGDTTVTQGKFYYKQLNNGEYEIIEEPPEDSNPRDNRWYEHSDAVDLNNYQLVIGNYNEEKVTPRFIIGNGDSNSRSNLMEVGTNLITIGNANGTQSYLVLDDHSMKLFDKEGDTYFYVSDLREKEIIDGSEQYVATRTEYFHGDGATQSFTVKFDVDYEVSAIASTEYDNVATKTGPRTYTFTDPPMRGHNVIITYKTASPLIKAYTFGTRSSSNLGPFSVVEGYDNYASGAYSHAEGNDTSAEGDCSHAEGERTTADGTCTHVEGYNTYAGGEYSHSEGSNTYAMGDYSHTQNLGTIAERKSQTVFGEYNIGDIGGTDETTRGDYAVIVGNGTGTDSRSNALTVDWQGRVECGDYSGNFNSLFDIFYPVGSYYETSDTTFDPNIAWGGTWSLDSAGRVTVAADSNDTDFDTVGATSGEKTVILTTDQIPAHTHGNKSLTAGFSGRRSGANEAVSHWAQQNATVTQSSSSATTTTASGTANKHTDIVTFNLSHEHSSVGGGLEHNNMPPYVVVNRWHRIA